MKVDEDTRRTRALTLFEVLVAVIAMIVLALFLMPTLPDERGRSQRIACVNNLVHIGRAFRAYAADHDGLFPMQLSTSQDGTLEFGRTGEVFRHFTILSNELVTPKILTCPEDKRKAVTNFSRFNNGHLSYFVNLDATMNDVRMLLAGDRNITSRTPVLGGIMILSTNQSMSSPGVGWNKEMHKNAGNAVLTDGSVQQLNTSRLQALLRGNTVATQRLALP